MIMMKVQDVLIASLFLSTSSSNNFFVKAIVSDECLESHDSLYYNEDLSDAKHNLLFSSPTKTQVENMTFMNSILDYNPAKGKTQHTRLMELCEEAQGTVCDVYTEVMYNTTQAKTIEIARPLCIPNSCEDVKEALDYLDPEPLHCNSNSNSNENGCQIVKHEIDCGVNHTFEFTAGGDCVSDKILMSQNRTISTRQKNILKRMDEECLEAMHARTSNWCKLEYSFDKQKSKIPFTLLRDWTELGGKNYKEFEEACIALNHTVCGVDTHVSFRNAELYEHGRPFCMPSSCQDEDIKVLYPSPLYCESSNEEDKDESDCQIVSQSISCIRHVDETFSLEKCVQDFEQTLNDPIIHRKSEQMLERMEGDCLDTLYGDVTSDICKLKSPTILHKARDVSLLPLQDLHSEFEHSCYEAGGAPCKYTVELSSKQKTFKRNEELSFVNTEYPVCLPIECENERRKDIANTFIFDDLDCGTNTNQQESTNQECVIRIMDDVCGEYPTPSPTTKPTPIPTPLPTQTPTNHPTKANKSVEQEGLPTLIDSQQQGNGGGVPTVMDITSTGTTTTSTDSPTVDIPVFGSGPTFYSSSTTTSSSSSSSLFTSNTNAFWRILMSCTTCALVFYFFVS